MEFKIKNASSFLVLVLVVVEVMVKAEEGTRKRGGHWVQLQRSIGISAMHMQVMYDNKVVIFDRTDFGPSNISLSNHRCRYNPRDLALKMDCTAHSVLYDLTTNTLRPLTLRSDAWCSSGALSPSGTLLQTGGFNDGCTKLRTFTPCPTHNTCDWNEIPNSNLTTSRWYASNQILPNGNIIVVGGRNSFTYEFVPKHDMSFHFLPFLKLTRDPNRGEENNLYPFLHLLPNGHLFIFANRNSILFDYTKNKVLRNYPTIPGQEKRNYPSTASSVLLPLNLTGTNQTRLPEPEIMICGGAYPAAFGCANKFKKFIEASTSCGRLRVMDANPEWVMEAMPMPRVMPDMVLLPDGNVIILNGARNGTAGWENAANPVLYPLLYTPGSVPRFRLLAPASTPRLYHSSAVLLPDGRVLVGGSNPHRVYDFRAKPYPTDLSLDAYYPDYLAPEFEALRPSIVAVEAVNNTVLYGRVFGVTFSLQEYRVGVGVGVTLVAPSFTTHSFAMNQRMMWLDVEAVEKVAQFGSYKVVARGPPSLTVAPPGYYMLFIVHAGIPSASVWLQVN